MSRWQHPTNPPKTVKTDQSSPDISHRLNGSSPLYQLEEPRSLINRSRADLLPGSEERIMSHLCRQPRIFVVDDEPVIASTTATILSHYGFDAAFFTDRKSTRLNSSHLGISY